MPNKAERSDRRFLFRRISAPAESTLQTASLISYRLHAVALCLAAGTVVAGAIWLGGRDGQLSVAAPPSDPLRPGYLICMRVGQGAGGSTNAEQDAHTATALLASSEGRRRSSARGARPRGTPSPVPTEEPSPTPEPTEEPSPTLPPPTPTPSPTPTEAPRGIITYQVAAGDTLDGLAERFGVSVETIVWANDLPGRDAVLEAGQSLIIPPVSGVLYTVERGDSLASIGTAYGVSAAEIAEANGLDPAAVLSIGTQLVIPGARPLEPTPTPAPTASPAPEAAPAAEPQLAVAEEPPPAADVAPESTDKGQEIVSIAAAYVGYPYTWGGSSPQTGFDCSGFTWYVYSQAGVEIPNHDMWGQLGSGPAIERGALLPGDLVFFVNTYKAGLSHTGIYAGDGQFIHAANAGAGVRYDRLDDAYWNARYYAASRPWQP